jgi:ABC-type amino acid transport substrate-binding protein
MSKIHLNRLYADLALLEFELEYLNNSLRKYYYTKNSNLSSVDKRRKIEYCRMSIPIVIQDIKDFKWYIQKEKKSLYNKKYGIQNGSNNQIDNNIDDNDYYTEYDSYPEYDTEEYTE